MHRHVRRVRHQETLRIEDGAGEIQPLLDVHAHRGVLQHRTGLLGHVHEQVVEQFEQHRIGPAAVGRTRVASRSVRRSVMWSSGVISAVQPGSTTVVALASRISAGPAMRSPASRSVRSNTGAARSWSPVKIWMVSIGGGAPLVARRQRRLLHRFAGRVRLHRHRLDHQRPVRRREAEARAMRSGEVGDDLLLAAQRNDQRRLGAGIAQMQIAVRGDARRIGALRGKRRRRLVRQPVGKLAQFRHGVRFERDFHRLFAHHRLVGKTHAIGRQHAGKRMDEHGLHAQRIGHQAGVLTAGAAEALQREACGVVALLHRHLLDRIRHVGDGDPQEALRHLAAVCAAGRWPARSHRRVRRTSPPRHRHRAAASPSGPKIAGKCFGWILPTQTLASVTVSGPPRR